MAKYSSTITGGPLMLPESRRIAALLMQRPSDADWMHTLRVENLLQKNTPATAMRQAKLIRSRLEMLPPEAWPMVVSGAPEVATQTLFAAAVLHSALLSDFLRQVIAAHHRKLDITLKRGEWEPFFDECIARDPSIASWTESTRAKLFQVITRMLIEARYLESSKTMKLRLPGLHPEVFSLLKSMGESQLIDTLELRT